MKKARLTKEKALREAVRILVRKMIKEAEEAEDTAAEEAPEDDTTAATPTPAAPTTPEPAKQEPPKEEPAKQEPPAEEPAEEEEEGLNPDFQAATDMFIRKLTQSTGTPAADDLIDMMTQMIERFTTTSEERLNLLKGLRDNTVQ